MGRRARVDQRAIKENGVFSELDPVELFSPNIDYLEIAAVDYGTPRMNYKLRSNMNEEDSSVREMGGDGAGTNPLKEEKKYFCFSNNDFFSKTRMLRDGKR